MFNYWAKPEHTNILSKELNDDLAQVIVKYPKKYIGLGTLPMNAPDLAVKELERCILEVIVHSEKTVNYVFIYNNITSKLYVVGFCRDSNRISY